MAVQGLVCTGLYTVCKASAIEMSTIVVLLIPFDFEYWKFHLFSRCSYDILTSVVNVKCRLDVHNYTLWSTPAFSCHIISFWTVHYLFAKVQHQQYGFINNHALLSSCYWLWSELLNFFTLCSKCKKNYVLIACTTPKLADFHMYNVGHKHFVSSLNLLTEKRFAN